ncbi:hypothetical protein O3P69_019058 [Scylla paramamosain]|uniref:Receptor ligand binding region domain-containing protein n=1 Tax=Scylla paramamosain TaxID=85552 RepID=A0AAW0T7V1_SCYPA
MPSIHTLSCLSGPPLLPHLLLLTGVLLYLAASARPYSTPGLELLDGLALEGTRSLWRTMQSWAVAGLNVTWPDRKVVAMDGDLILGGLMVVHERHNDVVCGPIMPQGDVQALEAMLFTLDFINDQVDFIPGVRLGAHILDDCDKDMYGLEQAVDFIKDTSSFSLSPCVYQEAISLRCCLSFLPATRSFPSFTLPATRCCPSLTMPATRLHHSDCHLLLPFPHTTITTTTN